ncbi:hypothetical protein F383_38028 [Gossypium arboreum]|uniref:Uncharacterized protein n=1 Tax=Gossypium arboreum TaxID=29729 RepID=A0A0B0MEG2_GOSAR|nr:hypothetical protein F383_38028 [Gossypium arboreum]
MRTSELVELSPSSFMDANV